MKKYVTEEARCRRRVLFYILCELLTVTGILASLAAGRSLEEILTGVLAVLALCLAFLHKREAKGEDKS